MLEQSVVTAGDLMTRDVVTTRTETPLRDAVKAMARSRISGLPVLDASGKLVGMLTEGDLVRWHEGHTEKQARWLDMLAEGSDLAPSFIEAIRAEHNKVKAAMSGGVTTAAEQTPAQELANIMGRKGIKRIPILRGDELVGIVARSDLVRALAQQLGEPSRPTAEMTRLDEALRRGREEAVQAMKSPQQT